jgi:hypothetical protein
MQQQFLLLEFYRNDHELTAETQRTHTGNTPAIPQQKQLSKLT